MIDIEELRKATERHKYWRKHQVPPDMHELHPRERVRIREQDLRVMADFAMAELTRRDAEQAEVRRAWMRLAGHDPTSIDKSLGLGPPECWEVRELLAMVKIHCDKRDAEQADRERPVAWMTFCPHGHEFDYRVFPDESECRDVANQYAMETGEDEWAVYPLVKGGG